MRSIRVSTATVFLWTHLTFTLEYSGEQIVKATVDEKSEEVELPVDEVGDAKSIEVEFTYVRMFRVSPPAHRCTRFTSRCAHHDSLILSCSPLWRPLATR